MGNFTKMVMHKKSSLVYRKPSCHDCFIYFFSNFIIKKLSTIDNLEKKLHSSLTTSIQSFLHGWQLCIGTKWKSFSHYLQFQLQGGAATTWFSHKQCFLSQNTCQTYTLLRTLCSHDYSFHFGYNNHNVTEIPFGNEVWIQTYVVWLGEFKLSGSLFNRVLSPIQFTLNHPHSFPIFL